MDSVIIGKLFGARVVVSTWVDHDTIYISPKEEGLFVKLLELEKRINDFRENEKEMGENPLLILGLDGLKNE